MRFLFPVLLFLLSTTGASLAGEKTEEPTPNPAKADFPAYWNAKTWDTAEGATFWTSKIPQKTDSARSKTPISQPPQPNDFLDRQSEK